MQQSYQGPNLSPLRYPGVDHTLPPPPGSSLQPPVTGENNHGVQYQQEAQTAALRDGSADSPNNSAHQTPDLDPSYEPLDYEAEMKRLEGRTTGFYPDGSLDVVDDPRV